MTMTKSLTWKRNEVECPPAPRHLLSSLFNDESEEYVTSDYYDNSMEGEGRDESSTAHRNDVEIDSDRDDADCDSPTFSESSQRSMDFDTFDGAWDDCADTSSIRMDVELPWQFIEFGFEETPNSTNMTKKKSNISKSKGKLIPVYDTEKTCPFPLQNITNNPEINRDIFEVNTEEKKVKEINYRIQQPRVQRLVKDYFPRTKTLSAKEKPIEDNIWSKCTFSSVATSPTLSIAFSEDDDDDDDDAFWEDVFDQSTSFNKNMKVAFSKRSTINNGSMIQDENKEQINSRHIFPNQVHLKTSYWTEVNKRSYMEDRVLIDYLGNVPLSSTNGLDIDMAVLFRKLQAIKSNEQDITLHETATDAEASVPLSLFAVFDGHGGHLASQFCSDWFSFYLQNQTVYPQDLPLALRRAFHRLDEDFIKSGNEDGTTSCVCAVVGGKKIICANAGDSRAIIVRRNGDVITLSRDHKPGSPRESKRIKDLGGRVVYSGQWRVEGRLAVSRSIGDSSLKKFVTSDPDVYEYDLLPDDWFLIIASDGIWDVLQNHQVASMALSYSCKASKQEQTLAVCDDYLKQAAQKIADHAKRLGSRDNLSILVIDLKNMDKK